jgi:hypothetical protein
MKNAAKKADGSIIPNSKDLSEMEENFNKLTPAETERLAWLIEECGEVVKAGSKILRHGYYSYDPSDPDHKGNRDDLKEKWPTCSKRLF